MWDKKKENYTPTDTVVGGLRVRENSMGPSVIAVKQPSFSIVYRYFFSVSSVIH